METKTPQDCSSDHSSTCDETSEWSRTNEWECETSIEGDHWFWSQAAAVTTCDSESTDDHLGSVCDNEFIDQLLSQGAELESLISVTFRDDLRDTSSGQMEERTAELSDEGKKQRSCCS